MFDVEIFPFSKRFVFAAYNMFLVFVKLPLMKTEFPSRIDADEHTFCLKIRLCTIFHENSSEMDISGGTPFSKCDEVVVIIYTYQSLSLTLLQNPYV